MCPIDNYDNLISNFATFIPYNDVLQRFRASKHSTIVRKIRHNIMESLIGDHFNGQISEYFVHPVKENYTIYFKTVPEGAIFLPLVPARPTLVKQGDNYFFYGQPNGVAWQYTPVDKTIVEKAFQDAGIALDAEVEIKHDSRLENLYEEILVKVAHIHRVSEPFVNFQDDPQQISEIKNIINALYYLEIVFIDVEHNGYSVAMQYGKTRENASKASQLLNLGVGLAEVFSAEIAEATGLLTQLYDGSQFVGKAISEQSIARTVGFATGVAVDQMQPDGQGNLDYDFLTNFTAVLPSYIDKATAYVKKYTPESDDGEALSAQKLKELQKEGQKLLTSIEKIQEGGSFGTLKLLNYIYLVGHIINLSTDILGQTGLLNDTTQKVIRDHMHYLKETILPRLFEITDKIEVQFMLQPGFLSKPLMEKVTGLYEAWAVRYTKSLGDLEVKGESLLKLNDWEFAAKRVSALRSQIDDAEDKKYKIHLASDALNQFNTILSDKAHEKKRLVDLPPEIKVRLLEQFKRFEPYLAASDKKLNKILMDGLTAKTTLTSLTYDYTLGWLTGAIYTDESTVSQITPKLSGPNARITKDLDKALRSQDLQISLNQDVIRFIEKDPQLVLFPYHRTVSIFDIAEKNGFSEKTLADKRIHFSDDLHHSTVLNPEVLTRSEASALHRLYKNKRQDLERAKKAREDLLALLDANFRGAEQMMFGENQAALKATCRELYSQIQPFLIGGHGENQDILKFDKVITQLFSGSFVEKPKKDRNKITPENFHALMDFRLLGHFNITSVAWGLKEQFYFNQIMQRDNAEVANRQLDSQTITSDRAAYLIKHTECSKHIGLFRQTLNNWTNLLDQSLQDKLVQGEDGLPFPELERSEGVLVESNQVLALKRTMNFFYYAEQLLRSLENINESALTESTVTQILVCVGHANNIYTLGRELSIDPYFSIIYKDVMAKLKPAIDNTLKQVGPYTVGAEEIEPSKGQSAQYSGLWYTLNALALLPDHIAEMTGQSNLSEADKKIRIQQIQEKSKRANLKIERIINHANASYLKLLLDAPIAYPLYTELLKKIKTFTKTTNKAVLNHIDEINTELFNNVLLELDLWEFNLGLAPGSLSDPMKEILDEYYRGLVAPLGFSFKKEEQLICNMAPIKKRHDMMLKRYNDALIQHHDIEQKVAKMNALMNSIHANSNALATNFEYQNAYSLIADFQKHCRDNQIELKLTIDDFARFELPPKGERLDAFKELIRLCKSYHEGLLARQQLTMDLSESKLVYFESLKLKQIEANKQYRIEYADEYFTRKLELYGSRVLGLPHLNKEYNDKLKEYLLGCKEEILVSVRVSHEIDVDLERLLEEKVKTFETTHIQAYYRLDAVMEAIHQYKVYLTQASDANRKYNSASENKSLDRKNKFIAELEQMTQPDVAKRYEEIKKAIDARGELLTSYDHSTQYDFKALKQRLVALFVSLGLYTTKRKVHFKKIHDALDKAPKLSALKDRFQLLITEPNTPVAHTQINEVVPEDIVEEAEDGVIPAWSLIDFFAISPLEIEALSLKTKLSPTQKNALIDNMHTVNTKIDEELRILPNVLNQFLKNPDIYALYLELQGKFSVFSDDTDDVVKQLDELNSVIFTKMLQAADEYEIAEELEHGSISQPLKLAMNDFFKTLVTSLNFDFKTQEKLIFNDKQTKQRNKAALERLDVVLIQASTTKEASRQVIDLLLSIKQYDNYQPESNHLLQIKKNISSAYKDVQALLNDFLRESFEEEQEVEPLPDYSFETMDYDETEWTLEQISETVNRYIEHNEALQAVESKELLQIQNELIALNHLQCSQDESQVQFRRNAAYTYFETQRLKIYQRPLGLRHFEHEYKEKLNVHLLGLRSALMESSVGAAEVDFKMENLILKKSKKFETNHIAHYHQLDAVLVALNRLENCFNPADDDDIVAYIGGLKRIAIDPAMDATQRYEAIGAQIADDGEMTFLSTPNASGFQYIINAFIALLEALHLYTPTKKKRYEELSRSLQKPVNIDALTKRFGLFYDPRQPAEPDDEAPELRPNPPDVG